MPSSNIHTPFRHEVLDTLCCSGGLVCSQAVNTPDTMTDITTGLWSGQSENILHLKNAADHLHDLRLGQA